MSAAALCDAIGDLIDASGGNTRWARGSDAETAAKVVDEKIAALVKLAANQPEPSTASRDKTKFAGVFQAALEALPQEWCSEYQTKAGYCLTREVMPLGLWAVTHSGQLRALVRHAEGSLFWAPFEVTEVSGLEEMRELAGATQAATIQPKPQPQKPVCMSVADQREALWEQIRELVDATGGNTCRIDNKDKLEAKAVDAAIDALISEASK